MPRRRPRTRRRGTHLVVGKLDGLYPIAMHEWLAYDLAQFTYAARRAETWGEFERLASARHVLAALDRYELMAHDAFADDGGDASVALRSSWTVAETKKNTVSRDDEWSEAPFGNNTRRGGDTVLHGRRIANVIRRSHFDTPFMSREHLGVNNCSYPERPE